MSNTTGISQTNFDFCFGTGCEIGVEGGPDTGVDIGGEEMGPVEILVASAEVAACWLTNEGFEGDMIVSSGLGTLDCPNAWTNSSMDPYRSSDFIDKALSLDPYNEIALDIKNGVCNFICLEE